MGYFEVDGFVRGHAARFSGGFCSHGDVGSLFACQVEVYTGQFMACLRGYLCIRLSKVTIQHNTSKQAVIDSFGLETSYASMIDGLK